MLKKKKGYIKIRNTCDQALKDGLDYAWVDTCMYAAMNTNSWSYEWILRMAASGCIDKSSSAELSEAINSMYGWYERSTCCYAYLADVSTNIAAPYPPRSSWNLVNVPLRRLRDGYNVAFNQAKPQILSRYDGFATSRWFSRGWTLQELIAPTRLVFFDKDWHVIGERCGILAAVVSDITGVDMFMFGQPSQLSAVSIATRMSWAARRETAREEDEAYCLLGIFGLNIPLLYGEGKKAFIRLQKAIVLSSADQSIFAWGFPGAEMRRSLLDENDVSFWDYRRPSATLAPSVNAFAHCGDITRGPETRSESGSYEFTNYGLRITLPVIFGSFPGRALAILNCRVYGGWLALYLRQVSEGRKFFEVFESDKGRVTYVDAMTARTAKYEEIVIIERQGGGIQFTPASFEPIPLLLQIPDMPLMNGSLSIESFLPEESWDFHNHHQTTDGKRTEAAQFVRKARAYITQGAILLSITRNNSTSPLVLVSFCYDTRHYVKPQLSICSASVRVKYCTQDNLAAECSSPLRRCVRCARQKTGYFVSKLRPELY